MPIENKLNGLELPLIDRNLFFFLACKIGRKFSCRNKEMLNGSNFLLEKVGQNTKYFQIIIILYMCFYLRTSPTDQDVGPEPKFL